MNMAHLHLMLNDIPVLGTMAGVGFLLVGMIIRKDCVKLAAYVLLIVAGFSAIPTVWSGDGAKEIIEKLDSADKDLIHQHEEAADLTYPFAIIMGVAAAAALIMHKHAPKLRTTSSFGVLIIAVVVTVLVSWTANLGGHIRHPETRPGFKVDTHDLKFNGE